MNRLRGFFSAIPSIVVIAAIVAFVGYSLLLYKPEEHHTCAASSFARQTDVAINVVRQWFGKQGQEYTGCQEVTQ
jgi:hypothetical protein